MFRRVFPLSSITLCACIATSFAQEPTIAPEIAPPLLPAPSVTAAPESLPATPSVPQPSAESVIPESTPPVLGGPVVPSSGGFAPPAVALPPVVLYPRVRVRSPHKTHPHGIPTIVAVADPREPGCLVNVEVCMPPCECLNVSHNRRGNRVLYDFGLYEIEIISRLGVVIVDYNS